ncbi:hypothetical protein BJ875DRAFT_480052 [Amylocarpus encephaloides]|uniref:Uncharacterized protein n=1 Tax=Amylocarpus encephaloides TaxID=45428 RepID=A0A9P7YS20_9HELO|nr:hypothetical protein BJ875DRAFT_480052 [Amylocarpus encephaloides]
MPPTQLPAHRPRSARDQKLLTGFIIIFFFFCILMAAYPTITLLRSDASRASDIGVATEDYGIDPAFNRAEKHLPYPILRGGLLKRMLKLGDGNVETEVLLVAVSLVSWLEGRTWTDSDKKYMDRLIEAAGQYWDVVVAASPYLILEPLEYIKHILLGFEKELRSSTLAEEEMVDILKTVENRLRQSFDMNALKKKRSASTGGVLRFQQSLARRDYLDDHISEVDQLIESIGQEWDSLVRGGTRKVDDIKLSVRGFMKGLRGDCFFSGRSRCSEKNIVAAGRKLENRLRKTFKLPPIQQLAKRDYIDDNTPFLDHLIDTKGRTWDAMAQIGTVTLEDIEEAKQESVDLLQKWCLERGGPCTAKNILAIQRKLENRLRSSFRLGPVQQLFKKDFIDGHASQIDQEIEEAGGVWDQLAKLGIATETTIEVGVQACLEALQQECLRYGGACRADNIATVGRTLETRLRKTFNLDPIQRLSKREPGDTRSAIMGFKKVVTNFYRGHSIKDIQKFMGLVIWDLTRISEPGPLIADASKDPRFVTSMGEWISSSSTQDLVDALEMHGSIPWLINHFALPNVDEIQNFAGSEKCSTPSRKVLDPAGFGQFTSIVTKYYKQAFNETLEAEDVQVFIRTSLAAASAAIHITQHIQSLGTRSGQNLEHKRDASNVLAGTVTSWPPAKSTESSGSILHPSHKWLLSQWLIFGASITIFGSLLLITLVGCIRRCRSKSQNKESPLPPTVTTINSSPTGLDGAYDGWLTSKPRSALKVAKRGVRKASCPDVDVESSPQANRIRWGSTV